MPPSDPRCPARGGAVRHSRTLGAVYRRELRGSLARRWIAGLFSIRASGLLRNGCFPGELLAVLGGFRSWSGFAERVAAKIAPAVGRARAAELVTNAVKAAERSGSTFADVVAGTPELAAALSADDIAGLASPDTYLGVADMFRQRLIAGAANRRSPGKP